VRHGIASFAREVGAVVLAILRTVPGVRPASAAVAGIARRGSALQQGSTRTGADGAAAAAGTPRLRADTIAQQRQRARRRELLRRRLRFAGFLTGVGAALVGWLVVPSSDVFLIRHVEVVGASTLADLTVRRTVDPHLVGQTIFTLDTRAAVAELEQLPFVHSARVERHLPGGVTVRVQEYLPLALGLADGAGAGNGWLVARDGRVLDTARVVDWRGRVPVVRLRAERVQPGMRVGDEPALQLLRAVPRGFVASFQSIEVRPSGALVGRLADGTEVRIGRPQDLQAKVLVVQRVLRELADDGTRVSYIDVTVPARPAWK
jgi:cell division septal protein FtsQ